MKKCNDCVSQSSTDSVPTGPVVRFRPVASSALRAVSSGGALAALCSLSLPWSGGPVTRIPETFSMGDWSLVTNSLPPRDPNDDDDNDDEDEDEPDDEREPAVIREPNEDE